MTGAEEHFVSCLKKRYEIDYKWRDAWAALGRKTDKARLAVTQERIERHGKLANMRIGKLMKQYDDLFTV